MIREKHLVPGRVLGRWAQVPRTTMNPATGIGSREYMDTWIPGMVISYIPITQRRHAKSAAERSGWDVLVFWLDDRQKRLENVRVPVEHNGWKVLW